VVGYDGSSESRAALMAAATRAGQGGTVIAVYASERASEWLDTPHYDRALAIRRERASSVFGELSRLHLGDVTVEAQLVDGPAPEALAEVAKRRDAQEIAAGSRGLGWLRAARGSVSHRLLKIADRRVVVVSRLSLSGAPARDDAVRGQRPWLSPISTHRFRF
jgi:nucleotide-binding universal stress UspA family protein